MRVKTSENSCQLVVLNFVPSVLGSLFLQAFGAVRFYIAMERVYSCCCRSEREKLGPSRDLNPGPGPAAGELDRRVRQADSSLQTSLRIPSRGTHSSRCHGRAIERRSRQGRGPGRVVCSILVVQVGNGIELEALGLQFEPYRWRPCGVIWDSSRTVVVIKLRRTSALLMTRVT